MSVHGGFSRINTLIRWASYLLLIGALGCLLFAWAEPAQWQLWLAGSGILVAIGLATYGIHWIIAGFLGDSNTGRDQVITSSSIPRQTAQTATWRWPIMIGAVVIGAFIVHRETGDVARYIGACLTIWVLVMVVSWVAERHRPVAKRGLAGAYIFSVLAIYWAVKTHLEAYQQRQDALEQVSAMRADLQRLSTPETMHAAVAVPPKTGANDGVETGAVTSRKLTEYMRGATARSAANEARYTRRVEALKPENWMAIEAVLNRGLRAKYRPEIQAAGRALDDYERESTLLLDEIEQIAVNAGGSVGSSFREGVNKSLPRSRQIARDSIATERAIFKLVVNFYDFLDSPTLAHSLQANNILFQQESDLQRYRWFYQELERLGALSEKLSQQAIQARAHSVQKLQEAERVLAQPGAR